MAKAKIKTLLGTGLAALCSHIKQCNTAIGDLAEATAKGFEETDDILHEKQDVTAAVSFTIPVDGWGEDDSSPGYFYCDIPIAGLLATDIVDVTVKTQDIMMPVDSDERSAISTYFSNLDHLITLHQRELEETKTYKKTLAKLLLTGIVRVQG